ncbi:MAG: diguanylate cyclase domain-containing protein [Limnochordia bacterium]|jgi:diguanylate cyclase (GGDEF)-like protein|nr:GGDEF domain-containing protein [Bacillota bacterium]
MLLSQFVAAIMRSVLAVFIIGGLALFFIGEDVNYHRLSKLSLIIGLVITPIYLLPMDSGVRDLLALLSVVVCLSWLVPLGLLASARSVLLGGGVFFFFENLLGNWAPLGGLISLLAAPSSAPIIESGEVGGSNKRMQLFEGVPLGIFFCGMLLAMALMGTYPGEHLWARPLVPFLIYLLVLGGIRASERWSQQEKAFPMDILDLVVLMPLVHLVITRTGGAFSPYQALYLLIIAVQSLKPREAYGLAALTLTAASQGYDALSRGVWVGEIELVHLLLCTAVYWGVRRLDKMERVLYEQLLVQVSIDDLTGVFNHRFLHAHLDDMLNREDQVYVIMIDLDDFKVLNDSMGHLAGNELLRTIAVRLQSILREGDILARWGGDEFVVVPGTQLDREQAELLADRIRRNVSFACAEFLERHAGQRDGITLTASVGIAGTSELVRDKEQLLRLADQALYRAKAGGKNKSVIAEGTV